MSSSDSLKPETITDSPEMPAPQPSTTTTRYSLPTQKIISLARFTGLPWGKLEKKQQIEFPPPSWSLDETQNDGAGASLPPGKLVDPNAIESQAQPTAPDEVLDRAAFAQRLSLLIDNLPPPNRDTENVVTTTNPSGPPLSPMVDQQLMKQLSSEGIMNGMEREANVWAFLEGIKYARSQPQSNGSAGPGPEAESSADVMMYAPLQPTQDSEPTIAESETVVQSSDNPLNTPSNTGVVDPSSSVKKFWVPSTTQLSLQTTWWGYRLYLPPPVMAVLSGSRVKTAQRATMITASLKWLLDRVPMMLVPPNFRPAVALLKRLGPLLGYIGVFIAWSWTAISKYDRGKFYT